ncbi:glutamine-hydrolyzing carbamoyl-phosphate synthase small subunit, partial [bacterium]|nr:glutamine-hydrolyzing carbamoyl-phosphate synthase small subunit [bacterium]
MKAILALADGTVLEGEGIGATGTVYGEVVFTTNMTGYQEVLTDPSFAGQIVTYTYPLVGNYGTDEEANESERSATKGLVVKEFHGAPWRGREGLQDWLVRRGITGIEGIDTRSLTQRIRGEGVVPGALSTELSPQELLDGVENAPPIETLDLVTGVSTQEPIVHRGEGPPIALLDCGVKRSIIQYLLAQGMEVVQYPAWTPPSEILRDDPAGIVVSPGPGDPKVTGALIETVGILAKSRPYFGICLGHQLLALALGGDTFKMKFGHRGGNHPVRDERTGRVVITTQNHGYAVDPDSLEATGLSVTHTALNDGTVEGLAPQSEPVLSLQYHLE